MSRTITETAISAVLARTARALEDAAAALLPGDEPPPAVFEAPRNPDFGDFASNVALQLAKRARRPPQQLASELVARIFDDDPSLRDVVAEATALGGFINVRLAPAGWGQCVATSLKAGVAFRPASTFRSSSAARIRPGRSSWSKAALFRSATRSRRRCASSVCK